MDEIGYESNYTVVSINYELGEIGTYHLRRGCSSGGEIVFRFDLKAFAGVDKDMLIAKMASVVEEAANSDDRCIDDAKELIRFVNTGAVRPVRARK